MLTIGKLGASPAQLDYYERQVAAGAEDYYAGRGETAGAWLGSGVGATDVGLSVGARVSREEFMSLMRGCSPRDGAVLRPMSSRSTVAAVDLTFSAPKSVSVLFAVADDGVSGALVSAHERAVAAAVSYLEREACWTRRGRGGADRVRGDGFVAAAYRHRLSRAGDPQLHTHVVVANLVRADGRYTALDAHALYEHKSAAGAVYRAVLRAEVRERLPWVSWQRVGRGLFEIDGVPQGVLREFSQRRVEIEERAAELGAADGSLSRERMQGIALATRAPKSAASVDGESWRTEARRRAASRGFDDHDLAALTARPASASVRPSFRAVVDRLSGASGLTGSHNTFVRRHALAEVAGEFSDGVGLAALERATEEYFEDPSVVAVGETPAGVARFTTEELLRCERAILDGAARRVASSTAVVDVEAVEAALSCSLPVLNDDQAAAVRALALSGHGVDTVQALAGTGKTTMLRTLADVYRRAGYNVIGVAPTARAARELREAADVRAGTLHALESHLTSRGGFSPRTVVLFDEAGMASTRLSAAVLAQAERAGAKVIAVGDPGQLASVEAGGWLAALTREHAGPELRQVLRQRDVAERDALEALHDGVPERYLEHKADVITLHGTDEDAVGAVVDQWFAARRDHGPNEIAMIARDNETRELLNRAARSRLASAGVLADGGGTVIGGREFAPGDRVIARRNDRRLGVDNGTLMTVTGFDDRRGALLARTESRAVVALDVAYAANHLEYAYAITGHSSQGATVEHAIVVGRPEEFTREWAYTALSRARQRTAIHLITDHGVAEHDRREYAPPEPEREPEEALNALLSAMRRSEAEPLASEHGATASPVDAPAPDPVGPSRSPVRSAADRAPGWASREAGRAARAPASSRGIGVER